MKKHVSIFIGLTALISVLLQLCLMLENRVASITETLIRFFSFFTILTNLLVGSYMNNKKMRKMLILSSILLIY